MNLVIDTGSYKPSEVIRQRIIEHARHLAQQADDIEECRVQIQPLGRSPSHPESFIARLDIVTSDGRMVIGDHAGWPSSDKPGGAVDLSFRRAFEVVRQHARHRRGQVREHRTPEHGQTRARVGVDSTGSTPTLRQD